jgi:azurin
MRLLLAPLLLLCGLAQAENCVIDLEAGDDMNFDQTSVTVSSSCASIEIKLVHTGKLPVAAMGHNVVITDADSVQALATDGMKAGAAAGYLPAGDVRVIASTRLIGGGESATASFAGDKLTKGGNYAFFCSFPGHFALMKGSLIVE